MIFSGKEESSSTDRGNLEWLKQEGSPFNNLDPRISSNAIKWTKHVHNNTIVAARIIHSFIRDLKNIEFLNFSTFFPQSTFIFSTFII